MMACIMYYMTPTSFMKTMLIILAVACLLASPVAVRAQETATVTGEVVDDSGLVIPGATVTATNAATGAEVTGSTDSSGRYQLTLEPGTYTVSAENPGFEIGFGDPVELAAGQSLERSFQLELAVVTESIVVIGSRAAPRSATESTVPVDVISVADLARQGSRDLVNQLRTVIPSFNINTQPISDAATVVRPANLRNLAPDHTLLLVNGKRRHRAAVITWLGNGIADGSQGPDLSVIPSIAIRQVEVLRDGAAAQYGSDAIAGVMNIQLKDDASGGSFVVQTGAFRDVNYGDTSTCGSGIIGDIKHSCNGIGGHGRSLSIAGNVGLPLGTDGFANISLEYGTADPTNRSIQRQDAMNVIQAGNTNVRDPAQVWGSPRINHDMKLFVNLGKPITDNVQLYGHGNYLTRKVTGGFYFRNPHTRGGVFRGPVVDGTPTIRVGDRVWAQTAPESTTPPPGREPGNGGCPIIPVVNHVPDAGALAAVEADPNCFTLYSRFPGGFTPQFGGDLIDSSLVGGLRGFASNGFSWDLSASYGVSEIDQFIFDTVNASLGFDTPTSFRPGIYRQEETNLNFDIAYPVTDLMHFAAGAEWRREEFTIGAGDPASWEIGPYAAQGFSSGSNGFNGYRADTTAGSWGRGNIAVYGDVEFSDAGRWTLGTALRVERFDDFGSTLNGKVSGRVRLTDVLAIRAAASTGFRAPTPGQQNAFNVTTAFIGGQLTNSGTVPATSAVAMARGGGQLQPEKSFNMSGGAVVEKGNFTFTADFFRVNIDDRLAVSQEVRLSEPEIETLLAEGIPEARNFPVFRFFLNDFSTLTQGVDLISTYAAGRTTFSAVFNFTDTEVHNLETSVIDEFRITTLEEGLPKTRWNFTVAHDARRWSLMGRVNYFGQFWDSEDGRNSVGLPGGPSAAFMYPHYGGKTLVDLEFGIPLGANAQVAVGGENILNTYPDVNSFAALTVGNQYGQFSPFGFNGANFYVRLSYGWGGSRPATQRSSATPRSSGSDPQLARQEVVEQIAELEGLHDELIGHLETARDIETDAWLTRRAEQKVEEAQMAKERDLDVLRTGLARRSYGHDVEPLKRGAELKQHHVKKQIAAVTGEVLLPPEEPASAQSTRLSPRRGGMLGRSSSPFWAGSSALMGRGFHAPWGRSFY